jgi:hypothetical protein
VDGRQHERVRALDGRRGFDALAPMRPRFRIVRPTLGEVDAFIAAD